MEPNKRCLRMYRYRKGIMDNAFSLSEQTAPRWTSDKIFFLTDSCPTPMVGDVQFYPCDEFGNYVPYAESVDVEVCASN